MLTAGRTWYLVLFHVCFHLLMAPSVNAVSDINAILMCIVFDHLIRTETLMAFLTVHQRVAESAQVSACHPGLRIHQDRAIHTYVIWRFLNKLLPPGFLYIVLKLYSKIAVIPCIRKPAIDLRPRVHESSGLCQRYNLLHRLLNHILFLTFYISYIIYTRQSASEDCFRV